MWGQALKLVLILALAGQVAACGRKGKLKAPDGAAYPRTYPDITFPGEEKKTGEEESDQ